MSDPVVYGAFAAHGNDYTVRGAHGRPGFRVYRDQGDGFGYLLGSVSDPGGPEPRLVIDGHRALTTGGAQECLDKALEVWRGWLGGES